MMRLFIFIILLYLIYAYGKFSKKSVFISVSGFFLLFVSGFRSKWVGADTPAYDLLYRILKTETIATISTHVEKGFLYFNKCLLFFSDNPQILIFVSSLIIIISILISLYKYSNYLALSVFLYAIDLYFFNLSLMRQSLALAILIWSIPFIQQRRWFWFTSLVLLASTFHHSALLFLIIYPLSTFPCTSKIVGIYLLGTLACIEAFPLFSKIMFVLFPIYQGYTESVWFGNAVKIASVMKILVAASVFFFSWFTWKKLPANLQEENQIFINLSLLGFCIMLISIRATLLERETMYFSFFNTILLPNMIMQYSKQSRLILTAAVLALFALYAVITIAYRPDWSGVIPYTFFWEV